MGIHTVNYAGIRNVPEDRILGRDDAGTGRAEALTVAEVLSLLSVYTVSQTDALLGAKADTSHNHAAGDITSGTLAHERGGLEADVSAYDGLVRITGGATSAAPTGAAGLAVLDDATAADVRTTIGAASQADLDALTSSYSRRRMVIARVDNTAAPPTEVTGDRYLLDATGASHAGWDGAAANDIVEFDGASWVATSPLEGWIVYSDGSNTDWLYVDDGSPGWQERTTGSGAPTDAQYVALAVNGSLTNERVLTGTANQITITDGGAGAAVTLSTPQDIHTAATPTFGALTVSNLATVANLTMTGGTITGTTATVQIVMTSAIIMRDGSGDGGEKLRIDGTSVILPSAQSLEWRSGFIGTTSTDTALHRQAAGELWLRHSTTGQLFGVSKTYTSATSFEAVLLDAQDDASNFRLVVAKGSAGGSARGLIIGYHDGTSFAAWLTFTATTGDATFSGAVTVTGRLDLDSQVTHAITTYTPAGTTETVDWSTGNIKTLNLGSASGAVTVTFTAPSGPAQLTLKLVQGATARDITWPASVKWDDDGEPTWSSDTSKTRIVSFLYDGTNYFGLPSQTFT